MRRMRREDIAIGTLAVMSMDLIVIIAVFPNRVLDFLFVSDVHKAAVLGPPLAIVGIVAFFLFVLAVGTRPDREGR